MLHNLKKKMKRNFELTADDYKQIEALGIDEEKVALQLKQLDEGFPYLKINAPATAEQGVLTIDESEAKQLADVWNDYLKGQHKVVKFVPASGAASRMFKNLFAFLDAEYDEPQTDFEKFFFDHITQFAFYDDLCKVCLERQGKSLDDLVGEGRQKEVVANLLLKEGLDYGQLPKGLLKFHSYNGENARTAMEEHLAEAALYACSGGVCRLHFTVSHQHLELFKQLAESAVPAMEKKLGVRYELSFSEQKPSTNTIAANPDGSPFRTDDGKLLFRPGGHGALVENLNEIDADIVFIKNIDNVVPDHLKQDMTLWKQVIAGVLVSAQNKVFGYLDKLKADDVSAELLDEIELFLEKEMCCHLSGHRSQDTEVRRQKLISQLDRPLRVCGMVRNEGEPGGGPFVTEDAEGNTSLQILESTQINPDSEKDMLAFKQGAYFNPVDLVCAVKNHEGKHYNLPDFIDKKTGFISQKSLNGKNLKALELPGLWNGSMSHWNTIFVEVPLSTFNPVKTVNDLLRPQHQG